MRANQKSYASIHRSVVARSSGWAATNGPTTLCASSSTVSHHDFVVIRRSAVSTNPAEHRPTCLRRYPHAAYWYSRSARFQQARANATRSRSPGAGKPATASR